MLRFYLSFLPLLPFIVVQVISTIIINVIPIKCKRLNLVGKSKIASKVSEYFSPGKFSSLIFISSLILHRLCKRSRYACCFIL